MKTENKIVTSDLADFGFRELRELEFILKAWREKGLPDDFNDDEVVPSFNTNSGYVFLTNSDYQVAMMNGDRLESFYNCPECGHEGFADEMEHEGNKECKEYLKDIKAVA
jgi:hypothetical protein